MYTAFAYCRETLEAGKWCVNRFVEIAAVDFIGNGFLNSGMPNCAAGWSFRRRWIFGREFPEREVAAAFLSS
ncbi:hypothetical protein [Streptomyces californicus]|uniref:hypothetical protein n=1 Tax=Streptomyces californicus TaxID=67351 RepID=UPI0037108B4A